MRCTKHRYTPPTITTVFPGRLRLYRFARVWAITILGVVPSWLFVPTPSAMAAEDLSDFLAQPTPLASPISEIDSAPDQGFFFGAGFHRLTIRSEVLGLDTDPMPPFADGGDLMLGWNWGNIRLEYIRQIIRRPPPSGFVHGDETLIQFGFDANQIWLTHGFRPWHAIRLGYGIGYQQRVVKLLGTSMQTIPESGTLAGLMVDYAFAPPFVLHLRGEWQQKTEVLQVSGQYLYLAYVVPF